MDYKLLSDEIGNLSAGLYRILEPYYKVRPQNPDFYISENAGFILAYVYEQGGIDQKEVVICANTLAAMNPSLYHANQMNMAISKAAMFYCKRLFEMNREKTWTMPDKIVYNLIRPCTWNNFDEAIPITEIDIFEVYSIWSIINDFISSTVVPRINKFR